MSEVKKPVLAQPSPYGVDLEADKDYWFCSCGLSKNQPFCDGSHKGTGLVPKKFKVTESKKYWLCGCKVTSNAPFCDGSHRKEAGVLKYNEFLLQKNTALKADLARANTTIYGLAVGSAALIVLVALKFHKLF